MQLGDKRKILIWTLVAILIAPPATDFATWSSWRQDLQRQADHAAMRAVHAIQDGEAPEPRALSGLPVDRLRLVAPPVIEHPPREGSYAGRAEAVRVTLITVRAPIFWSKLFGSAPMTAVGTAALVPSDPSGTRAVRVE